MATPPATDAARAAVLVAEGFTLHQSGDLIAAEARYRHALQIAPDDPAALHWCGTARAQQGDLDAGSELIERALDHDPARAPAWTDLGNVRLLQGQGTAAVTAFRKAIEFEPEDASGHSNLASALTAQGDLDAALKAARRATELAPDDPAGHANLGYALRLLGRPDEALKSLERVIELEPESVEARFNRGSCLMALDRKSEAAEALRQVVVEQPGHAGAQDALGVVLHSLGDQDAARRCFESAYKLEATTARRLKLVLSFPAIMESEAQIDAARTDLGRALDELLAATPKIDDPLHEVGMTPFFLAYHGRDDRPLMEKLARVYTRSTPSLSYTAAHCHARSVARAGAKIRVGFISTFFADHTIGRLTCGLVAGLDRSTFEVYVIFARPASDAWSARFSEHADQVIDLPEDLAAARERIAAARLDVLFYPDIGMHAMTYFLAYARLAPVQCVSWGHPDTTGIPNMDYFLSARALESNGAERHYSECLVREAALNFYFEPSVSVVTEKPRATFGLRDDVRLYLCAQSLFKLHPCFDAVMAAILRADPGGRLVLVGVHSAHFVNKVARRFADGFADLAERVDFVEPQPLAGFLSLASVCDVALDSMPFGATRTTVDILTAGTPVVTRRGGFLRGRMSAAINARLGLDELVVDSDQEYVERAVAVATDRELRARICRVLEQRRELIFHDQAAVHQLEQFFIAARAHATQGAAPATFGV